MIFGNELQGRILLFLLLLLLDVLSLFPPSYVQWRKRDTKRKDEVNQKKIKITFMQIKIETHRFLL